MIDACDRFIASLDSFCWLGASAPPWVLCITCKHPKAQHALPRCHSQAIVKGVLYQCALRTPHEGPHRQDDAEWVMHG